jgi:Zn-dependent protease
VLYALSHPLSLLVLLTSFVVGLTAHGAVQAWIARRMGDRRVVLEGRVSADPRRHVDPFGAVAALISGLGWVQPVDAPWGRRRNRVVLLSLAGPAVNVLAGVALLLAWRVAYGPADEFSGGAAYALQHGLATDAAPGALLLLAGASQLYLGVLSLVPLPPLDGGRLLFALAPRSHGWQRAEHQLVERNIGVAVLLALLVIPLGGPVPILPQLLDVILDPVLSLLVAGG